MSHQGNTNVDEALKDTLEENAEEQLERPRRTGINYERLGLTLHQMANNFDKIGQMVKIIEDAKKNNPRGLPF